MARDLPPPAHNAGRAYTGTPALTTGSGCRGLGSSICKRYAEVHFHLGDDRAARFLDPGGLWQQWLQNASHMRATADPATYLSLIRRLCAFVDECVGTI
nr:DUF6000 family protein [Streptomyces sp. SID12501]